jgi:hypothetical protein
MKRMIVCAERFLIRHDGEEYDEILEVEDQPTTATIQSWAERVKGRIRKLNAADEGSADRGVSVTVDAASPFNAMLINLQIIMKAEEGIRIDLPNLDATVPEVTDPEALRRIEKLEHRR